MEAKENTANPLKGKRIEFHILQSFPVSCLNRDDVGSPKTAMIGGVERARVSSQCWKRQVRLAMAELGFKTGVRTKDMATMIADACAKKGASEEQGLACGVAIAGALGDNTLLFFSESEADAMAETAASVDFEAGKLVSEKKKILPELKKAINNALKNPVDGLDIALFGRMVAMDPDFNIQGAASFAHAISTHAASNEVDFFTAIDDFSNLQGSAHMGALEYNSATYYRYISLDLGQLYENLRGHDLAKAVEAFTRALYVAVPAARQNTQTALNPWDYCRVLVRNGQGMQISFEKPVKADGGFLKPSKDVLDEEIARQEKLAGSMYGLMASLTYGKDDTYSIDNLVSDLATQVKDCEAAE